MPRAAAIAAPAIPSKRLLRVSSSRSFCSVVRYILHLISKVVFFGMQILQKIAAGRPNLVQDTFSGGFQLSGGVIDHTARAILPLLHFYFCTFPNFRTFGRGGFLGFVSDVHGRREGLPGLFLQTFLAVLDVVQPLPVAS